ncbi:hypothetical protein FRC18_005286 [Serendipita sp. 400]|nr:hypothetical protein FRC18_005286 [Serendipita sp. 400]
MKLSVHFQRVHKKKRSTRSIFGFASFAFSRSIFGFLLLLLLFFFFFFFFAFYFAFYFGIDGIQSSGS